jgi:hypothetical protein
MRIKIISDGTTTKVVCADTGEPVIGVQLVSFTSSVTGAPEAMLQVQGIQCDIICEAKQMIPDFSFEPYEIEDTPLQADELRSFFKNDNPTD